MLNWNHEQYAAERYKDMHRAAANAALVAAAQAAQPKQPRFYAPLLAQLGRRLVRWGSGLEARYTPAEARPY